VPNPSATEKKVLAREQKKSKEPSKNKKQKVNDVKLYAAP